MIFIEYLTLIADSLLDTEILDLRCSIDKLSLRLRILGGSVRRCDESSEEHYSICRSLWKFVEQDQVTHHQDKQIRKLANKLKKDLIRGKAALYTLPCSPAPLNALGCPNDLSATHVIWHIPSEKSMSFAVGIMKTTIGDSIVSILSSLQNLNAVLDGEDRMQSIKKIEEKIVSWLHGIFKSVRGASEVMGDEVFIGNKVSRLITTGHIVCDAFSPAIKEYLLMLRPTIIRFLLDFQIKLNDCSSKSEDLSSLSMSSDIRKVFLIL